MKKVLLLSLFFLLMLVTPVNAQGDPDDVAEANKRKPFLNQFVQPANCGVWDDADPANRKCCDISFRKMAAEKFENVESIVPKEITLPFKGVLDIIIGATIGSNPSAKLFEFQCTGVGVPEGEGASCLCKKPISDAYTPQLEVLCRRNIRAVGTMSEDAKKAAVKEQDLCVRCARDQGGIYTGMGCIPSSLGDFISNFVLRIGIGIAGFISLLCIIYSAILLQVSQGNPETIQKARDQITSCIIGLVMIIFSVFILRLIGVDILRIPGFS